jgi:hypothetical protein
MASTRPQPVQKANRDWVTPFKKLSLEAVTIRHYRPVSHVTFPQGCNGRHRQYSSLTALSPYVQTYRYGCLFGLNFELKRGIPFSPLDPISRISKTAVRYVFHAYSACNCSWLVFTWCLHSVHKVKTQWGSRVRYSAHKFHLTKNLTGTVQNNEKQRLR